MLCEIGVQAYCSVKEYKDALRQGELRRQACTIMYVRTHKHVRHYLSLFDARLSVFHFSAATAKKLHCGHVCRIGCHRVWS